MAWHPFFRIDGGFAKGRSPITAVARNPDHLDLFVTGTDGGIYSIYWDDTSGWAGSWFRIKEGIAKPGSLVTAVARDPDHLDLFVTGTDGGIYSIYWDAASSWASSWFRIRDGVAELGSPITAVARNPDHLDLFVTGTNGGIYSTYWGPDHVSLAPQTILEIKYENPPLPATAIGLRAKEHTQTAPILVMSGFRLSHRWKNTMKLPWWVRPVG